MKRVPLQSIAPFLALVLAGSDVIPDLSSTAGDLPPGRHFDRDFVLGIPEGELVGVVDETLLDPPPTFRARMPTGDPDKAVIRFNRCCAGFAAPSYTFELRGDGSAIFQGEDALVTGVHRYRVSPRRVKQLLKRLREADFWSLDERYDCGISHATQLSLSIKIGGKTKSVIHRCGRGFGYPDRLIAIEESIIEVARGEDWLLGTSHTFKLLSAEGFDYRSTAGGDLAAGAMEYGSDAFIRRLLARGTSLQSSRGPVIRDAVFRGRMEAFHMLVAAGAFGRDQVGAKEEALEAAITTARPEMLAEVLKHKPDVNVHFDDRGGRTPLDLAEGYGVENSAEMRRMLIAAGADPENKSRWSK